MRDRQFDSASGHNMKTNVFNDLIDTCSVKVENIEIFSKKTRDNENLEVKVDKNSGVIFIDDFFVGSSEYFDGHYKNNLNNYNFNEFESFEDKVDSERRIKYFDNFITNKKICDFGCGRGSFLRLARKNAKDVYGVEIQKNYLDLLNNNNIKCENNIENFNTKFDSIFMFHTLEHLPNQLAILKNIKKYMNLNGSLIIEVPHANDFLLKNLKLKEFKEFTLWSQHLILHTKESLKNFLVCAGFQDIQVNGFQRYSIANHFGWLKDKLPGGHKSELADIETPALVKEYQDSLDKINATDTLIAYARS